jgi:large subunit ribosomal protein L25
MSTDRVSLLVSARTPDQLGSRNARRLRKEGLIPGVLYGNGKEAVAIVVGERDLRTALSGASGVHTVLDVEVGGATHTAVVKDFQRHAIRGTLTHIDLHEVRLDQAIQATVALVLVGESPGAKQGGVVQPGAREVKIEALPTAIPEHVDVSIDGLEIGGTIRLADVAAIAGVTFVDDPETIVATCAAPRGDLPLEDEEAAAEGGEDSAASADETPAEE